MPWSREDMAARAAQERTSRIKARCSLMSPCEKLSRATSMPSEMSLRRMLIFRLKN